MNIKGKNEAYSLIKVHRENGRLNEELEISINSFSLEELIAIKLELAAQNFNSKMFGIPIWYSLKNVVQDALLKFALSSTKTKRINKTDYMVWHGLEMECGVHILQIKL